MSRVSNTSLSSIRQLTWNSSSTLVWEHTMCVTHPHVAQKKNSKFFLAG